MEYIDVFNYFKDAIENNVSIEIVQLKHGYMIFYWDDIEKSYYQVNELIKDPEALYRILQEELNK